MSPAVYYSRVLNFPGCHRCCKFIDIFFTTNIGHTWEFLYSCIHFSSELGGILWDLFNSTFFPYFWYFPFVPVYSFHVCYVCHVCMYAKFVISFVIVSMQCCFLRLRTLRHFEENTKQSLLIQAGTSFIWTNRGIFSSNNRLFNLSVISF